MKKPVKKKKPLIVPPDLVARIEAHAKASKRTPAQVLRDAIEMLPAK